MSYLQYIIVRKDLVSKMGIGKTSSQVAHASLGIVVDSRLNDCNISKYYRYHINVEKWLMGKFTKLVVYVKSKEKLLNIVKKLDSDELRYKLIYDSCLTMLDPEEKDGTTLTCMGIIPIHCDNVPKYLKKLRLLE